MASNDEVEAIASDPNFEIITTFAYSAGLPHNEASLSGSHCYLLQHGIDRLQAAASDLSWTAVAEDLRSIDRVQSLSKEVGAHMLSTHGEASKDPGRRFVVRLALKRDGILSIMSGPRPNSTDPLYPMTLSNIMNTLRISKIPVYLDTEPTTPSLFTKHKTTHRQPYNAAWRRVEVAHPVTLVDLCDVVLHRAVVLRENSSCEFTTDLRLVRKGQHLLSAEFSFSAAQSDSDAAPDVTCSGRIEVHLGEDDDDANREEALLPSPSQPPPNLGPVDVDLFYSSLKKVGLAFSGLFRGTKSPQRSLGYASASASWDEADGDMDTMRYHGNSSDKVTVQVKALDPTGIFSSSKTHLMVGLNGDLGQSICGFMARNGARHIAITSRGGEVNPEWLTTMQRQGINVGVYAMDVTNKDDIRATLEQMRSDGMPAVGGVANGALVQRDKLFLNMDAESFNDTLRPKVDGSRHLDELFGIGHELDYFVLFSSLATVAGNAGQSNYHAANMFMAGLAANRRARGLPASVMHVGVVADAGYVTRQGRQLLDHLRKQFFMPISESDAHQLFTEAVLASRPDSGLPADICMGLEPFPDRPGDADLVRPSWVSDRRLSHFVLPPPDQDKQAAGSCGVVGGNDDKALPLRQRLDSTSSAEAAEAMAMLQDAFSAKLETLLQLDAGSINVHAPLLDLGFDSLLAVETRTWFLREISVDVPVLRFLGGETISEICADTAATYLALRGATGSDVSDGADTNPPIGSDNLDDPVASSQSSAPSIVTPPLTSSPKTTARPSIDLPSGREEDLKTKASRSKSETKADGDDANSDTVLQTQSSRPRKPLRNTSRVERLSYLQSRLWSLGEALDDPGASNIAVCYSITGPLDVPKLREALAKVVVHHPSLRTCIYADDETGEPTQALLRQPPSSTLLLKQVHAATRDDGVIAREFSALKNRAWDLAYGETFGAVLVHVEDEDAYAIIFGYPLIFMDGVSWSVFPRDLGRAYSAQTLSRQTKLCIDAAAEQRRAVESMSGSGAAILYTELPEPLPFLPLASATHRKPLRRYEVHKCLRNIDSHLVAKIKDASRALRATPFHFYLATTQVLFSKLLPDLAEICIGVFDSNRPDDGSGSLADVVGYFVNVLPLRFRLLDDEQRPAASSFAEMVRNTAMHELEARRHGHVPFDVILDRLHVPRDDASVSPLCRTAFNYRVGAMADVALGDDCRLAVDSYSDVQNNRYDLSFGLFESAADSYSARMSISDLLDALASDASRTLSDYVLSGPAIEALEGISLDKGRCETWIG
ncbi:Nonribosomal peptide synthetase 14 [Colletotrichum tanaceti]|uniref:Nonribosomal peptide synthetase 14 n=1 Tax=Colletotrichum tanaceti TaxID=1306861 RepID=A0A4U6XJZ8_9PEZI|nr:Nonribosomal peptide synthetase 14 [Colletotrichum tanaceti]